MTNCFFTLSKTSPIKSAVAFLLIALPCAAQADVKDFGEFTIATQDTTAGTASGTYIAAGSGATGKFTIERNATRGYDGTRFTAGANGIMILNKSNQGDSTKDKDRFKYTISLTPTDNVSLHTIKIGQASYPLEPFESGTVGARNSEIARQTLAFTKNE